MHLIVCRNVFVYFNKHLQNLALSRFAESLIHGGFLCLGTRDELQGSPAAAGFVEVDKKARIYKRVVRT